MDEMRTLKIGIVGAGSIVRRLHAPGIAETGGAEIVAVCNSTPETARSFCDRFAPDAEVMDAYHEVVSHPDVDIVWIGTPPSMHCPVAMASLRSGKHVFCQSPMAADLAGAEEMWEASLSNPELVDFLCPPVIGRRGRRSLEQTLAGGGIGLPHQIFLRSCHAEYLDPNSPPSWRQRYEICGNQTLSLGIYTEILQGLFGNISAVSAHEKIVTPPRTGYEMEVPDILHVLCSFENGIEGSLLFSGVADHAGGDRLEIFGTRGTLVYDFKSDQIWMGRRGETELAPLDIGAESGGNWTVEADFLRAVRDTTAPRPAPDFSDGLRHMRVTEAIARSAATGTKQSVS